MAANLPIVFHCFNNSDASSVKEIHEELSPAKIKSFFYPDAPFSPRDFSDDIEEAIRSCDHFLLYLGGDADRILGEVQTEEIRQALAREKNEGKRLISLLYLNGIERNRKRLLQELEQSLGEEGAALTGRSAILLPNGVPDGNQIEQLQELVFKAVVWGSLPRTVRTLLFKAASYLANERDAAALDRDEIRHAEKLLAVHPDFRNRPLVQAYIRASKSRERRNTGLRYAAMFGLAGLIVLSGFVIR